MTDVYRLPETGFIRLKNLIGPGGPIPMASSTLWAHVKAGTFPAPVRLSPGITAWPVESIRRYIEEARAKGGVQG